MSDLLSLNSSQESTSSHVMRGAVISCITEEVMTQRSLSMSVEHSLLFSTESTRYHVMRGGSSAFVCHGGNYDLSEYNSWIACRFVVRWRSYNPESQFPSLLQ